MQVTPLEVDHLDALHATAVVVGGIHRARHPVLESITGGGALEVVVVQGRVLVAAIRGVGHGRHAKRLVQGDDREELQQGKVSSGAVSSGSALRSHSPPCSRSVSCHVLPFVGPNEWKHTTQVSLSLGHRFDTRGETGPQS